MSFPHQVTSFEQYKTAYKKSIEDPQGLIIQMHKSKGLVYDEEYIYKEKNAKSSVLL